MVVEIRCTLSINTNGELLIRHKTLEQIIRKPDAPSDPDDNDMFGIPHLKQNIEAAALLRQFKQWVIDRYERETSETVTRANNSIKEPRP